MQKRLDKKWLKKKEGFDPFISKNNTWKIIPPDKWHDVKQLHHIDIKETLKTQDDYNNNRRIHLRNPGSLIWVKVDFDLANKDLSFGIKTTNTTSEQLIQIMSERVVGIILNQNDLSSVYEINAEASEKLANRFEVPSIEVLETFKKLSLK